MNSKSVGYVPFFIRDQKTNLKAADQSYLYLLLISKLFDLLVFDQISTFFEDKFGFCNGKFKANAIDKLI